MEKRIFKRIFVFAAIACLLFACVPSVAFADVVEFQEAAKMGATIVDLYGSVNNTSLAYDALSDGSALTVIENLYQNYSSSSGDPYTLAAIGAAAASAGAIAVVYDAITGKGYVQLYQTQYIDSLDGFWDYTLGDLGLIRNQSNSFEWQLDNQGQVTPMRVFSGASVQIPFISNPASDATTFNSAFYVGISSNGLSDLAALTTSSSPVYVFAYTYNGTLSYAYCSLSSVGSREISHNRNRDTYNLGSNSNLSTSYSYQNNRIYWTSGSDLSSSDLPSYSSYQAGLNAVLGALNGDGSLVSGAVFLEPAFYVGDPLTAQPTITIPDPASPQYVPSPSRINTDIEWLPEWGDPLPGGVSEPVPGVPYPVTDPAILNDAVPEIWKSVVQGVQTDPGTDPDPNPDPDPEPGPGPSEVYTPLLPVTLPSFNFSFSGIWHYVREWVTSLGAWFTTLFSIWSALPYAMVVPVYATAVVVIVLGVYKRFFM